MAQHKLTWGDIERSNPAEIKKQYGWSERKLEKEVRNHLYGASKNEMKQVYKQFYSKNKER